MTRVVALNYADCEPVQAVFSAPPEELSTLITRPGACRRRALTRREYCIPRNCYSQWLVPSSRG